MRSARRWTCGRIAGASRRIGRSRSHRSSTGRSCPSIRGRPLAGGAGRDIELLVGHTRDEHRLFTAITGLLGEVGEERAAEALRVFAPGPDGARRYRDAYPAAGPEELYELVHADWLFRMPSLHLAEAQAAAGGRVHLYEADVAGPGHGRGLRGLSRSRCAARVRHASTVASRPCSSARHHRRRRRRSLPGCAARGRRSPRTATRGWPAYDLDRRLVQCFDATSAVRPYPEEASRSIWQVHTFAALGLVNG